eukprot:TRINITY_DN74832_c0_g1_i1.p1 TRINITY_DN74832_c0_g1~~TRINITY_DN74832_c0_g1_i1.p1  ORF type:complete len:360 (+),score=135.78 TRINITY_DN74832_c0_g1_i1:35-1114(+)
MDVDKAPSQLDVKELKRLKKEKKKFKEMKLLQKLDQNKALLKASIAEAAKPVPKNILSSVKQGVGRDYTVGFAVPGSILDNAQTPELRTYLAGQVARAAAIFNVDEIVVFNDKVGEGEGNGRGAVQLARVLQYLECPQYLRKNFFPIHKDLQYAGVLNPTDMPHHLRASEESVYREGVVTEREAREGTSWVNIGLNSECLVTSSLKPGLRVTVRLPEGYSWDKLIKGTIVSPAEPRTEGGLYWGYTTRIASTLSQVFTGCPHTGGYDIMLGTSEKGTNVEETEIKGFKHLLVVFGGVAGLEAALEADDKLDATDPAELFDLYLNVCPDQGSRTIRTEEAILVTMASLRDKIVRANCPST